MYRHTFITTHTQIYLHVETYTEAHADTQELAAKRWGRGATKRGERWVSKGSGPKAVTCGLLTGARVSRAQTEADGRNTGPREGATSSARLGRGQEGLPRGSGLVRSRRGSLAFLSPSLLLHAGALVRGALPSQFRKSQEPRHRKKEPEGAFRLHSLLTAGGEAQEDCYLKHPVSLPAPPPVIAPNPPICPSPRLQSLSCSRPPRNPAPSLQVGKLPLPSSLWVVPPQDPSPLAPGCTRDPGPAKIAPSPLTTVTGQGWAGDPSQVFPWDLHVAAGRKGFSWELKACDPKLPGAMSTSCPQDGERLSGVGEIELHRERQRGGIGGPNTFVRVSKPGVPFPELTANEVPALVGPLLPATGRDLTGTAPLPQASLPSVLAPPPSPTQAPSPRRQPPPTSHSSPSPLPPPTPQACISDPPQSSCPRAAGQPKAVFHATDFQACPLSAGTCRGGLLRAGLGRVISAPVRDTYHLTGPPASVSLPSTRPALCYQTHLPKHGSDKVPPLPPGL